MYKRLSIVMFPFLLVALIGTGIWGYLEHQEKNSVLIKAENQYQRAFHDLSFHMDKLHTELGNTLAVNSTTHDAYKKGLINVWRITSQAQGEITQLPLTLMPFNKTQEFLANIATFSYRAAVRDLSKQPLDDQEMKNLNSLYEYSGQLAEELRGLQSKVLQSNLRWMDVELALATQKEPYDNAIIDGFQTVEKNVQEYREIQWSPAILSMYRKHDVNTLSGSEMTADEVRQKAAQFLGVTDTSGMNVIENGGGTEYQSFSVSAAKDNTHDGIHMDFAKKGGQLLWFSASRDVPSKTIDVRRARDIAAQFLDSHGYKDMTPVSYDEYMNVANITFATRKNDVINYLEKVAVKVAMDNGEVTGLQATDYVFENKDRQLKTPKLTAEEARKTLNPNFQVENVSQALIRNDIDEEVLCYQFIGRVNGSSYRVYVNAESGAEEKIDQLPEAQQQVTG